MAFCVTCGYELPEDARFCVNCGAEVSDQPAGGDAAPEMETVEKKTEMTEQNGETVYTETEVQVEKAEEGDSQQAKKSKKGKKAAENPGDGASVAAVVPSEEKVEPATEPEDKAAAKKRGRKKREEPEAEAPAILDERDRASEAEAETLAFFAGAIDDASAGACEPDGAESVPDLSVDLDAVLSAETVVGDLGQSADALQPEAIDQYIPPAGMEYPATDQVYRPQFDASPYSAPTYLPDPSSSAAPVYTKQAVPPSAPPARPMVVEAPPQKTVSTAVYFWLSLLYMIPGLGLIMSIVFAIALKNQNIKNFSKAAIILRVIFYVLVLLLVIAYLVMRSHGYYFDIQLRPGNHMVYF